MLAADRVADVGRHAGQGCIGRACRRPRPGGEHAAQVLDPAVPVRGPGLKRVPQPRIRKGVTAHRSAPAHRSRNVHGCVQAQQGHIQAVGAGPADGGFPSVHAPGRRVAHPNGDPGPLLAGFVDEDMAGGQHQLRSDEIARSSLSAAPAIAADISQPALVHGVASARPLVSFPSARISPRPRSRLGPDVDLPIPGGPVLDRQFQDQLVSARRSRRAACVHSGHAKRELPPPRPSLRSSSKSSSCASSIRKASCCPAPALWARYSSCRSSSIAAASPISATVCPRPLSSEAVCAAPDRSRRPMVSADPASLPKKGYAEPIARSSRSVGGSGVKRSLPCWRVDSGPSYDREAQGPGCG